MTRLRLQLNSWFRTANNGAGSLLFYNLHIYQEAFTHYDMGYASAMAWFLLLIVMSITVVNLIASKYWVHTEEGET